MSENRQLWITRVITILMHKHNIHVHVHNLFILDFKNVLDSFKLITKWLNSKLIEVHILTHHIVYSPSHIHVYIQSSFHIHVINLISSRFHYRY